MTYGNRFLDPNAHRCLRQAKTYMWHAWNNLKAAYRHQFTRPSAPWNFGEALARCTRPRWDKSKPLYPAVPVCKCGDALGVARSVTR